MTRTRSVALLLSVVCVAGTAAVAGQVSDVKAFHRAGQTFITFTELDPAPTGTEAFTWGQAKKVLEMSRTAYRVFASNKPIDAGNVLKAELMGEVKPLSGWNLNGRNAEYLIAQAMIQPDEVGELAKNYNGFIYSWDMNGRRMDRYPLARLVIDEQAGPLPPGAGLFVASPARGGQRYYAVAVATDGKLDASSTGCLPQPVAETVGVGEPVRQGKGLWGPNFDYPGTRWVYVQWCAPPLAPVQNMYFNWSVLTPPGMKDKAPVELYFHMGNYSYAKPNHKVLTDSIQIATHDWPDSGWYGYNSAFGSGKDFTTGTVSNHTQKRTIAFLEWAKNALPIDGERIIPVGADGAAMLALNYPDLFAYVLITGFRAGVLNPKAAKTYEAAWGPKGPEIKDDQDRADWAWADLDKLVEAASAAGKDLPMFVCKGASWGRVSGYAKGRGRFYDAMHQTGQPLFAHWAWGGSLTPPNRYTGLWRGLEIRRHTPLPAFAESSVDVDSEGFGNTNMSYSWKDVKDSAESFAITVTGRASTFNMTPRRLRNFQVKPGEKIAWQAVGLAGRRGQPPPPVSGTVEAGKNGKVTLTKLAITGNSAGLTVTLTRAK